MSTAIFQEIYDDVVTLTGRPDLADETAVAIRTATRSIHGRYNFPRDLATELVKLPNAIQIVGLDIQTLFPRFRTTSTVRPLDSAFAPVDSIHIEIREIGDIYDPIYGTLLDNIAYVAGSSLNIRCLSGAYGFLVEYFKGPEVRPDYYNSWIAQLAPDAIIYQAASIVLSTNGNEEKAASYKKSVDSIYVPDLISNYGVSAGR